MENTLLQTPTGKLLYSTLRIKTDVALGTSFMFSYPLFGGKNLSLLITNKHVVEGCQSGSFFIHIALLENRFNPIGSFRELIFDDFESEWYFHPDKNIDLCALPVQSFIMDIDRIGVNFFRTTLNDTNIWDAKKLRNLNPIEEVVMYGYPTGLWDEYNNLPIMLKGSTASHPWIDFNGRPEGIIDMAVYPGSSGSPIIIANEGVSGNRQEMVSRHHIILLGVLTRSPPSMMHLGYYIKAKEILVLAEFIKNSLY